MAGPITEQQITDAARAAMAAPRQLPVSIFSPFDAFCWASEKRQPVGLTKEEGRDVAWLLTCAASKQCTREDVYTGAQSLAYVVHLRREGPIADALYKKLAGRANELVHIREVEEAMGCTWGEVDITIEGRMQRVDPYFWHILETTLRESVSAYVDQLESSLAMLRGCEPRQLTAQTHQAMAPLRRAVSHHLSQALLSRDSTSESTVRMLQQLRAELLPAHVAPTRHILRAQVRRVRALARLVAASDEQLDSVMQEEELAVLELFSEMPCELEEQLASRRVGLHELSSVFTPLANGLLATASSVPPASFAVRASMLARWLRRCRQAISEACVATIATLNRVAEMPVENHEWSGVELCIASPSDPRTRTATPEHMMHWKPPGHLGQGDDPRVLVGQKQCTFLNSRAARLFGVLVDQAQLGLLPALTMRASLLLPIVARFTAEGEVNYGQYVDMQLRPLARKCSVPWPEDALYLGKRRGAPSPTPSDDSTLHVAQQPRMPPLPPGPPPPLPQATPPGTVVPGTVQSGNVPPKLLRDHAILHGLCLSLQPLQKATSMRMPLDEIVSNVRKVAPMLASHSDSSLRQAVRWACCEVIKRAHAQALANGTSGLTMEFSSERDRTTDGKVGGVVCEGPAVAYLFEYTGWCVNQMRFNGVAFCNVWRASRSAQSRAGAMGHKLAHGAGQ